MLLYRIVLLLVLLLPGRGVLNAQQLRGSYCYSNSVESTCICFGEGDRFYYTYSGCTGSVYGKGIFSLLGNYLVLSFKATEDSDFTLQIDSTTALKSDSVYWRLIINDDMGESLPGAIVSIEPELEQVCDLDGKATLTLPRDSVSRVVSIKFIGIRPSSFSLSCDKDYTVRVAARSAFQNSIADGTTYRLAIRKIQHRKLELKKEYKGACFETYIRK